MMNTKAIRNFLVAFVCLLLVSASAQASIVTVGSLIKFQNGPGGSGGEFGIAHAGTPSVTEFVTFCVEKDEFVNFSSTYYVESIEKFADRGGVNTNEGDPVDATTAWLYYNFRMGTLFDYVYGDITDTSNARKHAANRLQNAVWHLEEEQAGTGSGLNDGAAYVAAAQQELFDYQSSSGYTGNMQEAINRVRIMNIRKGSATGAKSQSQLYLLPEPASALTWAVLAIGFVGVTRRRK